MIILVTGGTGFIGSHTCCLLLEQGHDVVVVDDLSNSSYEVINRISIITGKKIKFIKGSILNFELLDRLFIKYNFDAVIHFAGSKAVGESFLKPIHYYQNNVIGAITLINVMKKYNTKKLIFSSSATVYGENAPIPYKEIYGRGNITNPYGRTKAIIEQIIEDYSKSNLKFSAIILRYFNPIGAHESGLLGESPLGIPNNLLPIILQVATKKKKYLSIYGNDYNTKDGTCRRDYIHIMDLARGHIKALNSKHEGLNYFNLGTGRPYSVFEILKSFEENNKIIIKYKIEKKRLGDLPEFWADSSKAKKELNWVAEKNLDSMMIDAWRWQKNNPLGYDTK